MKPQFFQIRILLVAIAALSACNRATAPPSTGGATSGSGTEITGEEIVARMREVYRNAKSYADHAECYELSVRRDDGVERRFPYFQLSLAVERPNKFRLTRDNISTQASDHPRYAVASNGTVARSWAAELPEQIHQATSPAEFTASNLFASSEFREAMLQDVALENLWPQLAMLLEADLAKEIFPQVSHVRLLGRHACGDRECYAVQLRSPAGRRILWIDTEDFSLRRMRVPTEAQWPALNAGGLLRSLDVWIDFRDVSLDAKFNVDTFEIEVPAGARLVRELIEPPPPAPPAALGKPLGEIAFTLLAGETITAEQMSEKIVLLDFWSITCPPCQAQTPVLEEVRAAFADDTDMQFYAVSTDPAAVPNARLVDTLKRWGSEMPVVRDLESTGYQALGVRALPTLVLVGNDGRVHAFLPGAHTNSKPLIDKLKRLQEGQDLAAETMSEHEEQVAEYQQKLDSVTIGSDEETPGGFGGTPPN